MAETERRVRNILRIIYRQHRFEIRAFAIAAGVVLAIAISISIAIASLGLPSCVTAATETPACKAAANTWSSLQLPSIVLNYVSVALVTFGGLVFGVQTVAKEIDTGTTMIVWTMTPSRSRWMLERVAVLAGIVGAFSFLLGLGLDTVHQVSYPLTPLSASLADYQTRGWMIPAYALIAYAVGLLLGAIVGRPLQALIVGLGLTVALLAALVWLGDAVAKSSLELIDDQDRGGLVVEFRYRDDAGRVMTYDEAASILSPNDPRFALTFSSVAVGVRGEESFSVIARQVVVSALVASLGILSAGVITNRRRPS